MPTDPRGKVLPFTIGDYDLVLSEPSDESEAILDAYVRRKIMHSVDEASQGLPGRSEILAEAIRQTSVITFMSTEGMRHITTIEGMGMLLYHMSKRMTDKERMPTQDQLTQMLKDHPEYIQQLNDDFMELMSDGDDDYGE